MAYGWNFVSLPVIPTGAVQTEMGTVPTWTVPISEVLSSLTFGIDYDQLTRHIPGEGHKSWCNDPRYNQFENMEYLRGYQLYALRDCTLTITGTLPQTQASLPLEPGHNLIGVGAVSDGDTPAKLFKNISYTALKTLDSSGNLISVSNTTALVAGKAYYITLTSISTYYSSTLFGDTTFVYDGDGGRIKRITPNDETIFIGSLYEIKDGIKATKHIFLGDTRICSLTRTVGATSGGEYAYYHTDHLGSTSDITDASGVLKQHTEYLPYGETYTMSVGAASGGESASEYLYTGKLLDSSTGLYYYGARYYDPEIGRFTQADTIIPDPDDPQAFNRYSYARNNPVKYTDPTGHGWFSKWWDKIVGVAATVISIIAPPLAPAMMALNFAISAYTAIDTGNFLSFAGGLVGGALFGAIGADLALGMAARMGDAAWTFAGGAITGAVEFGFSGFGAGFGAALASGESFSDSLRAGGFGAAVGAATGAVIQGSYMEGWQDVLHGNSYAEIGLAQGNFALQSGNLQSLPKVDSAIRERTKNKLGIYLHGTNAEGASKIKNAGYKLKGGSWVTKPHAFDPLTRKTAIMLNPSEYRIFTGIVDPTSAKGEFFALLVAPSSSVIDRGRVGAAPQWQVNGEHALLPGSPFRNPNR